MNKNKKKGFTLVELLAVIVILAIILVIAVPQIMNTIKDTTKASFESSAKMVAAQVENQYTVAQTLSKEFGSTGSCMQEWAGLNSTDYESCEYEIASDGTAKITLVGKGKFKGLYVENGTRNSATAVEGEVVDNSGVAYITNLLAQETTLNNGLVQTTAEYNGTPYNAGIRYVGDNPNNKVYYNCEDTYNGVSYGKAGYDYANACEVWSIIGVFEVEDGKGNKAQRIKIINTESTFKASWDSSASGTNSGKGINQWGPSGSYEGADLMQLLNGYYISKPNSECKYNNASGQSGFGQTCTKESLVAAKMKPLTAVALSMATSAVWDTYATNTFSVPDVYLQEKGISTQYTGNSECVATGGNYCNDGITRTTSWPGLVGLMSTSDITYANGWLYNGTICPWSITTRSSSYYALGAWFSRSSDAGYDFMRVSAGVWPTLYLDSNVQIIGGNGQEKDSNGNEPFILAIKKNTV